VTLGTLTIYRGMALRAVGRRLGQCPPDEPEPFKGCRACAARRAGAVVDLHRHRRLFYIVLMTRTRSAARFYAVGGNPTASVYAGIDVGRTRFLAFCISGASCRPLRLSLGVALRIAYVDIANGFELDIIAACVIGGISIAGGIGSVARRGARRTVPRRHQECAAGHQYLALLADGDLGQVIIIAVVSTHGGERKRKGRVILRKAEAV
jgi:rhamnose transport system permease protein